MKTVALTGRATQALPEDRSSAHVGILDCQILSGGDLILSPVRVLPALWLSAAAILALSFPNGKWEVSAPYYIQN